MKFRTHKASLINILTEGLFSIYRYRQKSTMVTKIEEEGEEDQSKWLNSITAVTGAPLVDLKD